MSGESAAPRPIVLRRGGDRIVVSFDRATALTEVRAFVRAPDAPEFAPSAWERLAIPADMLPLLRDALGRLEAEARAVGLLVA